jgi:hypothetical protein
MTFSISSAIGWRAVLCCSAHHWLSHFQALERTAVGLQFLCAGLPSANFFLQRLHLFAQRL